MKYLLVLALVLATPCFALEDTPENRGKEADLYLAASPPAELLANMTAILAKKLPEDQREKFISTMSKNVDISALTATMKASLVKIFTADELKALAEFYGSPLGKSAMKKFNPYMADVMPGMQTEIKRAYEKTQAAAPSPTPAAP